MDIYLNSNTRLCSLHFLPICFVGNHLRPGSEPSLLGPTTPSGAQIRTTSTPAEEVERNLVYTHSHPKSELVPFDSFKQHSCKLAKSSSTFVFREIDQGFLLFVPEEIAPFRNIFSMFVKKDKSVTFYSYGKQLSRSIFSEFFTKKYFLTCIKKYKNLICYIETVYIKNIFDDPCPFAILKSTYPCHDLIDFFAEQLRLSLKEPNGRRYTPNLIIFCFMVLSKSRSAYLSLCQLFILPTIRSLDKYSSGVGSTLQNDDQNFKFLVEQCKALRPYQRDITLKYDEIQTKAKLEFRSGQVFGYAENRENELATHLQCFMIRSIKSNYREMAKLVPVFRQNATFLRENLLKVINALEKAGFRVMAITSDNAPVNRNVTKSLTENFTQSYFISPNFSDHKIFIMKDAPHFIKSIRNCWLNLRNEKKTFSFPPFKYEHFGSEASFESIRDLYNSESLRCLRLGFKLTYSSLYPSSIERQKVPLALKIFDETTSAAIFAVSPEEKGLNNFLKLINKLWKCFNVNNTTKGINKNDPDSFPYKNIQDPRLAFLREIADWVDSWKNLQTNYGKLSPQTFFSVSFSCRSMADAIEYLITKQNYEYVLSETFSSDCIEGLFGIYRQSNGGSPHMSVAQILAVERKRRVMSTIKLHGRVLELNDSDAPETSMESDHSIDIVYDSLNVDLSDFIELDETDKDPAVYVGGFISKKLAKYNSCKACLFSFECSVDDLNHPLTLSDYFDDINRGKLTIPSPELVTIILKCAYFFHVYISNIISSKNIKLSCLSELFHRLLADLGEIEQLSSCADHPCGVEKLLNLALNSLARIFLKNQVLAMNNQAAEDKQKMAKKNKYDSALQFEKFYT